MICQEVVTHVDNVPSQVFILTIGDVSLSLGKVSLVRVSVVISGVESLGSV